MARRLVTAVMHVIKFSRTLFTSTFTVKLINGIIITIISIISVVMIITIIIHTPLTIDSRNNYNSKSRINDKLE